MSHTNISADPAVTNRDELIEDLAQKPMLGEIVSYSMDENRGHKNSYVDVINALQQNGLDHNVAKPFTNAKAFTRACSKLKKDRVIDILGYNDKEVLFQISKKATTEDADEGGVEVEYKKENKLLLEKDTGVIHCKNTALKEKAEKLLAEAMEARTTGDVNNMLDKLYSAQSDRFPVGVGVYFVPSMYTDFNEKVAGFMKDLGRKLLRFPIPKGDSIGDRSVYEVVSNHINNLITDMKGAVNAWNVATRQNSIDSLVNRMNETTIKAESYLTILGDHTEEIMNGLSEVAAMKEAKLTELDEERKNNPQLAPSTSQDGDKILSVADSVPKSPKKLKELLGWPMEKTINGTLVKLVEAGKLGKLNGGYVKL